jgi:hypothetical protein
MAPYHRLFLSAVSVGMAVALTSVGTAQMRTKTKAPYPTVSKNVSWIVNVPYVTGGGPEQQLDLYVPTDHHGEPSRMIIS